MFFDHNGMKLEINKRRAFGKFTSMWKLNNTLLNNQQVKAEIQAVLREKFIAVNDYIKKEERSREWEDKLHTGKKIFAKDIPDKELLSKIHKEHLKLNNKKTDVKNDQKT